MADAKHPAAKPAAAKPAKGELPKTMPPMELEQDERSRMWMYSRPAWIGGPAIAKNGVVPITITERADAERAVNALYPGSFPDKPAESAKSA